MPRVPTPTSRTGLISPGHFVQGINYDTWRPQGSGDWLLIYTESGAGRVRHHGKRFEVHTGDILLFEPSTEQDYRTAPDPGSWGLYWAHFLPRPHWQAWLHNLPVHLPGVRLLQLPSGELRDQLIHTFEEILSIWRGSLINREDFAMNTLEKVLLLLQSVRARDPWFRIDSRIREAMRHMEQSPAENLSLGILARACGLSVSRFAHLFREQTGITPQRHLENLRMTLARQLIESTPLRVNEVAREVGFSDPLYFSSRFKRWWGRSPTEYRASILDNPASRTPFGH